MVATLVGSSSEFECVAKWYVLQVEKDQVIAPNRNVVLRAAYRCDLLPVQQLLALQHCHMQW